MPDGYRSAILALTVKLWLAVLYARRKNASAFSALLVVIPNEERNLEKGTLLASPWGEALLCGDEGQTNKTLA
ncbi:MAG TPA: hypothetical protein DEQ88_01705, partial [Clostridiales bacterium]|nr:hypothetical protein [Clostridiales bacterium]